MGRTNDAKHVLKIISLNDAKAECSCGWYYMTTGPLTKEAIKQMHDAHKGGKR